MTKQQTQTQEVRRKKLLWRANHRGMKELDLVIGTYAVENINQLDRNGLDDLEAILEIADPDMLNIVNKKIAIPPEYDNQVMHQMLARRFTAKDYNTR